MAQFSTFYIPTIGGEREQEALNAFLRSKRVLRVDKTFDQSGWAFCVEWIEGAGAPPSRGDVRQLPKVDYREILSEDDFSAFSKLRNIRKTLAQRDGVQVYTIATNEQLAEIAKNRISDLAALKKIDGFGESRITKYGSDFISVFTVEEVDHHEKA